MLTVVFDEVRNTGGVTVEVFLNLVIANDELCSKNGLMSLSTSKMSTCSFVSILQMLVRLTAAADDLDHLNSLDIRDREVVCRIGRKKRNKQG